jgi:hypothetical protein
MIRARNIGVWGLLVLALIASGCSNVRRLGMGKPLKNQGVGKIIHRYESTISNADWYGMRLAVSSHSESDNQSFKVNVRMRRDSAIWLSITPALGVEVARIMLTEDSVKFFSKVPGDRFGYLGDYTALENNFGAPVDFKMLQSVLLGHAVELKADGDDYISRIDELSYVLITKYKRRVMRLVGAKDKEIHPDAALEIVETTARDARVVERVLDRSQGEDLLVKRYWFDGLQGYLVHSKFDDLYNSQSIDISHTRHTIEGGGLVPQKTTMMIRSDDLEQKIEIEITRLRSGRAYEMPFKLPADVELRSTF